MRRRGYALAQDVSVERLLERERQDPALSRLLWHPLCVSALNTRPGAASAQTFLNVLRDSISAGRSQSDLLLPRVDLSALFPEPAARYVTERGGDVLTGERVTAIEPHGDGFTVRSTNREERYSHVVCALAPYHAGALLAGVSGLGAVVEAVERLSYQPIYSVYLRYPLPVRLPAPMVGFDSALLQWGFDRGVLCGQEGVIGLVISAEGAHQELAHEELAELAHQELQQQIGLLPQPAWCRVIAEKRATFACVPGLERPASRTPLRGLHLAGDYVASGYPGTIEAAVRSGVNAGRAVLA